MKKIIGIVSIAVAVYFGLSGIAHAATFTVTKTADTNDGTCDADCSLREAVIAANAAAGADTIDLPAGTYTLTIPGNMESNSNTGDLDIKESLTIAGAGAKETIVDAGGLDRIFEIAGGAGVTVGLSDMTIQNGDALANGGGIFVNANATVTIDRVTIRDNRSAMGGGGINTAGTLTMTDSAITGNVAFGNGGGLYKQTVSKTIHVNNSTISGNRANGHGGGIYHSGGTVNLASVTVTDNTADDDNNAAGDGGGVWVFGLHPLNFKDTLIAGNTTKGGTGPDCKGTVVSGDFNLIEDTSGCTINGTTTNNITGQDPLLAALADNGGPTPTHALNAGSPAIDAGDPGGCADYLVNPLNTDQRGETRYGPCDIGAFEFGFCGDGVLQPSGGEVCDDGNAVDTDACLSTCIPAACGDGFVEAGVEECDDGNTADGDGCSASCTAESPVTPVTETPPADDGGDTDGTPAETTDDPDETPGETTDDPDSGVPASGDPGDIQPASGGCSLIR